VQILSQGETEPFIERWFEISDADHFWFRWRLGAALALVREIGPSLDAPLRVLDIGCGSGIVKGQLEAETAWRVDGADLDRDALARIPPGRGTVSFYDIHDRRPELAGAYDVVVLFDVIEHLRDRPRFLASALYHLRPGGTLLVNVPALGALMSRYDEAAGHVIRYDRHTLAAELSAAGVEVTRTRYWGLSLVPLLWLRKLAVARLADREQIIERGFKPPGELARRALLLAMSTELRFLRVPPLGSSVLAAGTKR
jgi:SAM-dependent methyltransferase